MPKRIVFLMSDTGGGHRAAAEAIRDAILERYGPDSIRADLVDVYKRMNFPANRMPEFYPWIVNNSTFAWSVAYRLGDSPKRARLTSRVTYRFNRANLRAIVREYPADAVCCVHSVVGQPAFSAYNSFPTRPPWVTVVTDLVTAPYFWYDRRVDLCLVPTEEARERGLECGLKPDRIRVTGLPVHPNFTRRLTDKPTARAALQWPQDRTIVMLVAGGDGMGPLLETAVALLDRRLPNVHYVVVCGRNAPLKEKVDAAVEQWGAKNVSTYGFVTNMPQFMAAADILVTKAGPSTITESAIAGLPLVLSGAIPGQEDGNVQLVVENNAGTFAPGPAKVADVVAAWIAEGPAALLKRAESVRRIARPNAVWDIADAVWAAANRPYVASVARARA